jgi:hypothetical protein
MNIPIKEDEIILTPEQQERMYWAKIKYDSHKWIEYHKGYYKCEFCDLIHTSMLSFETVNICKKNPNLFDVRSSFTLWDMFNAFYGGRAVGSGTDEDTRFQDLVMKYDTFEKFLKEYQKSQK